MKRSINFVCAMMVFKLFTSFFVKKRQARRFYFYEAIKFETGDNCHILLLNRGILIFFWQFIQHGFICRSSSLSLHSVERILGLNPGLLLRWHWQSDALTMHSAKYQPQQKFSPLSLVTILRYPLS